MNDTTMTPTAAREWAMSLLEDVTPGPWRYGRMDCGDYWGPCIAPEVTGQLLAVTDADAVLMAAAPALARRVIALAERIQELERALPVGSDLSAPPLDADGWPTRVDGYPIGLAMLARRYGVSGDVRLTRRYDGLWRLGSVQFADVADPAWPSAVIVPALHIGITDPRAALAVLLRTGETS